MKQRLSKFPAWKTLPFAIAAAAPIGLHAQQRPAVPEASTSTVQEIVVTAARLNAARASIQPSLGASVLPGITRDTVLTLAAELGIPIVEQTIPREMLYIADEVFFSGTAAEVTPIRSVDRITVGSTARSDVYEVVALEHLDGEPLGLRAW